MAYISTSTSTLYNPILSYAPTLTATVTNPTLGNSTLTGQYQYITPNLIWLNIHLYVGSTFNKGSGEYRFSMPSGILPNSNISRQALSCVILDNGTDWKVGTGILNAENNYIFLTCEGILTVTDTLPMTWQTGDGISVTGIIAI